MMDHRSAKAKTALPTTLFCVIFLAGSRATSGCRCRLTRFRTPDSGGQQRARRLGLSGTRVSPAQPPHGVQDRPMHSLSWGYRGMNRRGRTVRSSFRNGTSTEKRRLAGSRIQDRGRTTSPTIAHVQLAVCNINSEIKEGNASSNPLYNTPPTFQRRLDRCPSDSFTAYGTLVLAKAAFLLQRQVFSRLKRCRKLCRAPNFTTTTFDFQHHDPNHQHYQSTPPVPSKWPKARRLTTSPKKVQHFQSM